MWLECSLKENLDVCCTSQCHQSLCNCTIICVPPPPPPFSRSELIINAFLKLVWADGRASCQTISRSSTRSVSTITKLKESFGEKRAIISWTKDESPVIIFWDSRPTGDLQRARKNPPGTENLSKYMVTGLYGSMLPWITMLKPRPRSED